MLSQVKVTMIPAAAYGPAIDDDVRIEPKFVP